MFTRMPDEYYDETPMNPKRPMTRSKKRVPQHTMEGSQSVLPGVQDTRSISSATSKLFSILVNKTTRKIY